MRLGEQQTERYLTCGSFAIGFIGWNGGKYLRGLGLQDATSDSMECNPGATETEPAPVTPRQTYALCLPAELQYNLPLATSTCSGTIGGETGRKGGRRVNGDDIRDGIESSGPASDPQRVPVPDNHPSVDWERVIRAYVNEDWFTTGLAEYLEAQASAAEAARPAACLGCGRSFPRQDLWVNRSLDDVAYCDACYYRRFGRWSA